MNKRLAVKILYYSAVIAIAAGTGFGIYYWFVRSPQHPPPPAARLEKLASGKDGAQPAPQGKKPILELHRPEITHIVDGKTLWQVKADEVETDPETGASVLRGVEGQVFGDEERVMHFQAPLTFYDPASGTVRIQGEFHGDVGAETQASLRGRDLQWNNEDRKLQVADAMLAVNGTSIRGDAMTILPEMESVQFKGNVRIEIELSAPGAQ